MRINVFPPYLVLNTGAYTLQLIYKKDILNTGIGNVRVLHLFVFVIDQKYNLLLKDSVDVLFNGSVCMGCRLMHLVFFSGKSCKKTDLGIQALGPYV